MDLDKNQNLANQDFIDSASLKDVPATPDQSTPQALSLFAEGICRILSHWDSLIQTATVRYRRLIFQRGEFLTQRRRKLMSEEFKQIADDIFIWFSQSKDQREVKSLEDLIQQIVISKYSCCMDDGSIFLVSSKLEMLHQKLMQGDLESIEELRKSTSWIGQDTFDWLEKKERRFRHLFQRKNPDDPKIVTKQPNKSSIVKDMKKTRIRRHHPKRLQLLLSSLHILD
ncbi:hypothetical protein MKW92_022725 [Papaver armeniacum]|nr:hypothetical protein MKW92_022725 [Papaver armeniacum]